jgi:hypothetical protein
MNNNTTNKKKLELKKTAIANLTLSEAQMRMMVGGGGKNNPIDSQNDDGIKTTCTTVIGTVIDTDGCPGRKTI